MLLGGRSESSSKSAKADSIKDIVISNAAQWWEALEHQQTTSFYLLAGRKRKDSGQAELFGACTKECTIQKHLESFHVLEMKCLSFKSLITFQAQSCVWGNACVPKSWVKCALNCTKRFIRSLKISFNSCFPLFPPQDKTIVSFFSYLFPKTPAPVPKHPAAHTPVPHFVYFQEQTLQLAPRWGREHPRGRGATPPRPALVSPPSPRRPQNPAAAGCLPSGFVAPSRFVFGF